jgi:hypothetical protein
MSGKPREIHNRLPREGWDAAFTVAAPAEDDLLLLAPIPGNSTLRNGSGERMISLSATAGGMFAWSQVV